MKKSSLLNCQAVSNKISFLKPFVSSRKVAFTLAEVLITLGIIGIVAAMTLPTLMSNYQKKVFETQFKKAYSNLSQVIREISYENPGLQLSDHELFCNELIKKYNIISASLPIRNIYTYNKKNIVETSCVAIFGNRNFNTLGFTTVDGVDYSIMKSCGYYSITFDINGSKRPNALGHDVFTFYIAGGDISKGFDFRKNVTIECEYDDDGNFIGYIRGGTCSKNDNSSAGGAVCAEYALQNVCPDDSTKTYWECLP